MDSVIWLAISISSILLAFESPITDPKSKTTKILNYFDYAMTIIFALEVIIKVIAKGLLLNGPQSYMRSASNLLDLFVVIVSIISMSSSSNLSFIKIIRMAKLARPMRLIFRNENLKISMKALIAAIPQIFNLLLLVLLIYAIFGIIGVNLLKGKLFYCNFEHVLGQPEK